MSGDWLSLLQGSLDEKNAQARMRKRGGEVGPRVIDFGSNDYLGLACHPGVVAAFQSAQHAGSGASPVLNGYGAAHRELEQRLARLCRAEDALVFSSGYSCNVGVIACLASAGDLILSDELNHASLIDGCRLSKAAVEVYPHNDAEHLAHYLADRRGDFTKVIVLTESVFSMDGDCANLNELAEICEQYHCGLVVDEAHALGVFGERGSGLVEEFKLEDKVFAKLGTLSKAVGTVGGYVCGSGTLVEFLVNHCRSYMFSTAPPAVTMLASAASVDLIESSQEQRRELRALSTALRSRLRGQGWDVPEGESPIIPLIVGGEAEAVSLSARLRERGVYVPAIRPPTVPVGKCRLRISLSTVHSHAHIEMLVDALQQSKR